MPSIPIDNLVKEMKSKPYTLGVLLLLCMAVPYLYKTTAKAGDVAQLSAQVSQINVSLLEARLRAINSEIFDIESKIQDKVAAHKPVDEIYTKKLLELRADKEHTERLLK
jgi:hypothetical protein